MDDSEATIEELLKMAEKIANSGDKTISGRQIGEDQANEMIAKGYVDIHSSWSVIVGFIDDAIAHAVGAVWVPGELLHGDNPEQHLDAEGRYPCILSTRHWFDEDKLFPDEVKTIYTAIEIVIGITRAVRGARHDPDPD